MCSIVVLVSPTCFNIQTSRLGVVGGVVEAEDGVWSGATGCHNIIPAVGTKSVIIFVLFGRLLYVLVNSCGHLKGGDVDGIYEIRHFC